MSVQKIWRRLRWNCRDTVIYGFENNSRRKWCSRGVTRGNTVPLSIFGGRRSQRCQDKGNGDTLAFFQIGLQRNAKYIVKVNSFVIKVKCLISCIVICIGESIIHQLKLNIITALFYYITSQIYIFSPSSRFTKCVKWRHAEIICVFCC